MLCDEKDILLEFEGKSMEMETTWLECTEGHYWTNTWIRHESGQKIEINPKEQQCENYCKGYE